MEQETRRIRLPAMAKAGAKTAGAKTAGATPADAKADAKAGRAAGKGRALKVYRTAVGFHDAYVAAPSQKAALAAWGTDKDLFARGAAELVDDPALTAEPLAAPGTVIRRTRGSLAEQLKAAGSAPKGGAKAAAADAEADRLAPARPARPRTPKPRPSRATLDAAEAALAKAQATADADRDALRREEEALRKRRDAFERERRATLAGLDDAVDQARHAYEAALERWQAAED